MFETLGDKLLFVGFIISLLVIFELQTGYFGKLLDPPQKPKISASNYPDFVVTKAIPDQNLVISYNPALAIVSPDRTPFIDLVLKIQNKKDVPRTLKLVYPDPSQLLTDDPRFVVAQSTFKDENTGQTYHRIVLFLPANSTKEVKIRYQNAYEALDELNDTIKVEVYGEEDQNIATIPFKLYSVVDSFEQIWPYPTLPTATESLEFYDPGEISVTPNTTLIEIPLFDSCIRVNSSPKYYTYTVPAQFSSYPYVEFNIVLPSAPSGAKYNIYADYGSGWILLKSEVVGGQTVTLFTKTPRAIKVQQSTWGCSKSNGMYKTAYVKLAAVFCYSYASAQISYVEGNSTYTLARQEDGNIASFQLPSQVTLVSNTVNTVPVKLAWGSNTAEANLPVFYDPNHSNDLLWKLYDHWKNNLEVNGQ
ncbi:MAG: hypothetical protein GXN93_04805 [Candidatus Diapherotrites archaeon]|nr:hypothetical protein [Candidatus Diapherotrites archaeon]